MAGSCGPSRFHTYEYYKNHRAIASATLAYSFYEDTRIDDDAQKLPTCFLFRY